MATWHVLAQPALPINAAAAAPPSVGKQLTHQLNQPHWSDQAHLPHVSFVLNCHLMLEFNIFVVFIYKIYVPLVCVYVGERRGTSLKKFPA